MKHDCQVIEYIKEIAKKYGATKVVLFGSRARGDHNERSDWDLVFFGAEENRAYIWDKLMWESPTLNKMDVLTERDLTGAIAEHIKRDGVVIYDSNEV